MWICFSLPVTFFLIISLVSSNILSLFLFFFFSTGPPQYKVKVLILLFCGNSFLQLPQTVIRILTYIAKWGVECFPFFNNNCRMLARYIRTYIYHESTNYCCDIILQQNYVCEDLTNDGTLNQSYKEE